MKLPVAYLRAIVRSHNVLEVGTKEELITRVFLMFPGNYLDSSSKSSDESAPSLSCFNSSASACKSPTIFRLFSKDFLRASCAFRSSVTITPKKFSTLSTFSWIFFNWQLFGTWNSSNGACQFLLHVVRQFVGFHPASVFLHGFSTHLQLLGSWSSTSCLRCLVFSRVQTMLIAPWISPALRDARLCSHRFLQLFCSKIFCKLA